jgi:hypothetical protein
MMGSGDLSDASAAATRFAYDTGLIYRTNDAGPTARAALASALAASNLTAHDETAAMPAYVPAGDVSLEYEAFDPDAPAGAPNGTGSAETPGRRLKAIIGGVGEARAAACRGAAPPSL